MNKLAKKLADNSGATLVVVITIFAVVVIAGSILISIGAASYKKSISFHNQKQAYYTARSVLDSVITSLNSKVQWEGASGTGGIRAELDSSINVDANGKKYITSTGAQLDSMGTYEVKITKENNAAQREKILITVTSKYKEAGYQLKARLTEGDRNRINPIDFMFYAHQGGINFPSSSPHTPILINGGILGRGALRMSNATINGTVINNGGADLQTNTTINGKLIVSQRSGGDLKVQGSSVINGEIYSTANASKYGSIDFPVTAINPPIANVSEHFGITEEKIGMGDNVQPASKMYGKGFVSVSADDSMVYLGNGVSIRRIEKKIYLPDGMQISLYDGSLWYALPWGDKEQPRPPQVDYDGSAGFLPTYKGFTIDWGNQILIFPNGDTYTCDGSNNIYAFSNGTTKVNLTSKTAAATGIASIPVEDIVIEEDGNVRTITSMPIYSLSGNVTISDEYVKSASSLITGNITFDTGDEATGHDIDVVLDTSATSIEINNADFIVNGDHNIYIYVPKNVTKLTISGNSQIGKNASGNTNDGGQIYIMGMGATEVIMKNKATIKGAVYFPGMGSSFKCISSESIVGGSRIVGSVTSQTITLNAGDTYTHIDPHKEPKYHLTLNTDEFGIYPPLPVDVMDWRIMYGG